MDNFERIIATVFNIPEETVNDEMSSKDIEDWDSMNYLLCIAELEKEFDVSFSMDEVMNAESVGNLRQMITLKIQAT